MYLQNFVLKKNKLYFITKIKTRETVIFCQKEKKKNSLCKNKNASRPQAHSKKVCAERDT